jgi:hypothetical protein
MKRMMILGAAGIVVLLIGSAASAQTSSPTRPGSATGTCVGPNFVDADGDGVCDHYQAGQGGQRGGGKGVGGRKGYGPGDGTGNQGAGPKDGTGYGPGAGTGGCDGTGRQGRGQGQGRGRGGRV